MLEVTKGPERSLTSFMGDNWELPTDIGLVDLADRVLTERLIDAGWSKEDTQDFVISVFHEALINAFAHGNLGIPGGTPKIWRVALEKQKNNPTNKKVYVKIKIEGKKVTIIIRDEGDGYDYQQVPDPTRPENQSRTTGRGGHNMQAFCDSITHSNGGREITIVKESK
jgi:serine/threonine-protein kinase RsbW